MQKFCKKTSLSCTLRYVRLSLILIHHIFWFSFYSWLLAKIANSHLHNFTKLKELLLLLHLYNGLFSRTTWVSQYQKGKTSQGVWGWQWHQMDHMQTICTSLQTDNDTNTSSLNFLQAGCSTWCQTNSVKAPNALYKAKRSIIHITPCVNLWRLHPSQG